MPPRTPDDARVAVARALARLGARADEAPRELAVALVLAEGITAEEALARCGVELPPARPAPFAFVLVPPGGLFRWGGARWRKATAKQARRLGVGAPNATPVDGGDGRCFRPDERVERVPVVRVPTQDDRPGPAASGARQRPAA